MKQYEYIDHTADVGLRAYGMRLDELFQNAALGLTNLITDEKKIKETIIKNIRIIEPSIDSLLVSWLNELIYIFDTESILFRRFEVSELDSSRLRARGYGEKVDSSRHRLKTGVKAATYHMLSVNQDEDGVYQVRVIFDI